VIASHTYNEPESARVAINYFKIGDTLIELDEEHHEPGVKTPGLPFDLQSIRGTVAYTQEAGEYDLNIHIDEGKFNH
jgi:hypothetical protein